MKLIKTEKQDAQDIKENRWKLYRKFLKRLLKDKKQISAILSLMFLGSILYASIPFIIKEGVQKLYLIQTFHYVLILAFILIIANTLINLAKEKLMVNFSLKYVANLKKDLFKSVLRKTVHKFKNIGVGKVLAYLSYNISLIKSLISQWGAVAIQQVLNFLALFIASFFIDSRLALLFFAFLPVFVIYLFVIQYIVRTYALKLMTFNKQIFINATETLHDFENMKIMALEERKAGSFNKLIDKDLKVRINRTLIYQYNHIILHGISLLLIIAFVTIGGQFLNQQEMAFSEFIFFVLYIHLLFRPFEVALRMSSYFEAGKIGIKTVFPYLSEQGYSRIRRVNLKGAIKIDNAVYKHPKSRFKLSKINLDIKPGEKITIIGDSSSGKSTFLQMLLHLRKLQKGKIYFDDKTQNDLGVRTIRRNISLISKDYLLSTGTLFNFLISGRREKMGDFDDKLIVLCQGLKLNSKIIQLGGRKFQSKIYKDDIRFSESEKLKFALVRAVYQDSPILVLDNFWHTFDKDTKQQIRSYIKEHCSDKTVIQLSNKEDDLLIETDKSLELKEGKLN